MHVIKGVMPRMPAGGRCSAGRMRLGQRCSHPCIQAHTSQVPGLSGSALHQEAETTSIGGSSCVRLRASTAWGEQRQTARRSARHAGEKVVCMRGHHADMEPPCPARRLGAQQQQQQPPPASARGSGPSMPAPAVVTAAAPGSADSSPDFATPWRPEMTMPPIPREKGGGLQSAYLDRLLSHAIFSTPVDCIACT